jgi:hypothetical protein
LAGRLVFRQTQSAEFTYFNAGAAQGAAFFDGDLVAREFQGVKRAYLKALPTAGAFF